MLANLTFIPTLFRNSSLCVVEQYDHNRTFNLLDENYLVPDLGPILMGKPCWLDAYMCCYMLNKYLIPNLIWEFCSHNHDLTMIGGIQFLLNQPALSI